MTPPLRFSIRGAPWYVVIICAALASPFYLAYTQPTNEFTGIGIARPQLHRCCRQQVVQSSKRRRYADYLVAGVVTKPSEQIRAVGPMPTARNPLGTHPQPP